MPDIPGRGLQAFSAPVNWHDDPGLLRKLLFGLTQLPHDVYQSGNMNVGPEQALPYAAQFAVPGTAMVPKGALGMAGSRLVVARKLPGGTVQYGKPGQLHSDLIASDEWTPNGMGRGYKGGVMGFAYPGGKFLTRDEAAKVVNNPTLGLDSMELNDLYSELHSGGNPLGAAAMGAQQQMSPDQARKYLSGGLL